MPEADRAGICGWNGWGTFGALYANFGGSPLPMADTLVCEVTVTVLQNAQPGRARILGVHPVCADASGEALDCTVVEGWVDVQGPPAAMSSSPWSEHDTLELDVLLYEGLAGPAPGQSESTAALLAALGLRGLLLANPPREARRAMGRPITPAEAAYYAQHPQMAGAMLHRTLTLSYASAASRDRAVAELRASSAVERVHLRCIPALRMPPAASASAMGLTSQCIPNHPIATPVHQDHLGMLGISHSASSNLPGGWGLVAVVDTGIEVKHPELKSFTGEDSISGSFIPGGNYLPHFSVNVGGFEQPANNVDENQRNRVGKGGSLPVECDPDGDGKAAPTAVGHGTHVAGLIAANAVDGTGVSGVCRHCGLGIVKSTRLSCSQPEPPAEPGLSMVFNYEEGVSTATGLGAQVINLSGGAPAVSCVDGTHADPLCKRVKDAHERDIFVVASSGNHRTKIQAPANYFRAAAIGGIDQAGGLWDRSPGSFEDCPAYATPGTECGSNYTTLEPPPSGGDPVLTLGKQELVALASNVVSTLYTCRDWNAEPLGCGESVGPGPNNDGIGLCTGTSMSAPQIAGIVGLLRSIHPLLPVGELDPLNPLAATGLRKVLAATASGKEWSPQTGWATLEGADWDPRLGWGPLDVAAAAQGLLGFRFSEPIEQREPVRNRAIPLFSLLVGGLSGDHAAVATPQLAMALSASAYIGDGDTIPSYGTFPNPALGLPRARAYVLSTEFPPLSGRALTPLYLMVKPVSPKQSVYDHILVSSAAHVQVAADLGYVYAGRQGYIYPHCGSQPGCTAPLGTELLHLKCRANGGRCAVFPHRDLAHFGTLGFNQAFPGIADPLGYAYGRGDADSDGLPDAAEYVLGTDPNLANTDGDLADDGIEYPFADLPLSDPCDGPLRHRCALNEAIFRDGFEE